jgi:hypothetical protein
VGKSSVDPVTGNPKNHEAFIPFSLDKAKATYMSSTLSLLLLITVSLSLSVSFSLSLCLSLRGKTVIEKRRKSAMPEGPELSRSFSVGLESEPVDGRPRSSSLQKRTKTLFIFEVVNTVVKGLPARVYAGEEGSEYSCTGWVFGCSSQKDAEEWVRYSLPLPFDSLSL